MAARDQTGSHRARLVRSESLRANRSLHRMSPDMARVGSPALVAHVGHWGKTGQHLLVLSFTGFDPQQT